MKRQEKKDKVFVGLSGGVDSSVSAALLKQAGFDVTGVFIKVWQPDWIECTWKEDRLDAMRVCARLNIPFKTLNLEKEYKKEVVDYMIAEYKAGRTPNPDIMCNRYVKFGGFFDWAMKQGADYVATGHYTQVKKVNKKFRLLASEDANKDQSYFLWTLTQRELSKTLFPIGHLEKPDVRKLAKKFGLITAEKKDSQGLCFIGKIDMKEFLKHYIPKKTGKVLNQDNKPIGTHDGAFFYAIGQRHGFLITEKTSEDTPYYIVAKNVKKNTLTVSHKSPTGELILSKKEILLKKTSWTADIPKEGKKYQAQIRYRQILQDCSYEKMKGGAKIVFKKEQYAVSAGQSLVLYDKKECLGGGIIQ
jgi:tRNA-specific 2-thiouridylase